MNWGSAVKKPYNGEIVINKISDEQTRAILARVDAQYKKKERNIKMAKKIMLSPVVIALRVFALISKCIGYVTAVFFPLGVFFTFQTVSQLRNGVPFSEVYQTVFVLMFVIIPFAAFTVNAIINAIADNIRDRV